MKKRFFSDYFGVFSTNNMVFLVTAINV